MQNADLLMKLFFQTWKLPKRSWMKTWPLPERRSSIHKDGHHFNSQGWCQLFELLQGPDLAYLGSGSFCHVCFGFLCQANLNPCQSLPNPERRDIPVHKYLGRANTTTYRKKVSLIQVSSLRSLEMFSIAYCTCFSSGRFLSHAHSACKVRRLKHSVAALLPYGLKAIDEFFLSQLTRISLQRRRAQRRPFCRAHQSHGNIFCRP